MKYLFILFFALTSNLSFASYHGGDTTTPATTKVVAVIAVAVLLLRLS